MTILENGTGVDIERVYEEYFPKVYNYVFYRLMNRENAEDVTSQVFMKLVKHAEKYDAGKSSVGTWVMRIAENTLIDYYRSLANHPVLYIDDETLDIEPQLSEDFEEQYASIADPDRKELYKALSGLREDDRALVYYKYFEDKNNFQIAAITGLNASTVGTRLMRIRAKLREALGDFE